MWHWSRDSPTHRCSWSAAIGEADTGVDEQDLERENVYGGGRENEMLWRQFSGVSCGTAPMPEHFGSAVLRHILV